MHLHNYVIRLIYWWIFIFQNIKNSITDPHYPFKVMGNVIFPNSLFLTNILNSLLTFLAFFLLESLIRFISLLRLSFSLRYVLAIAEIFSMSYLFWSPLLGSLLHRLSLLSLSLSPIHSSPFLLTFSSLQPLTLSDSLLNPQPLDFLLLSHCWMRLFKVLLLACY